MQPVARIEPPGWVTDASTRAVLAALGAAGAVVRFVGGCVRDALLDRPIGDIDIATQDPPEKVLKLLAAAAIKAVPTGIAHGTVTAVVVTANGAPRHFEITTLRRDVETFGRHARVAFTDDWAADAARRDFTMNALFLDAAGQIFDPVGGLEDLRAGRVRFVGDAERVQRRALHHLGLDAYRDLVLLRAAETGAGDTARALLAAASGRVPPRFPLRGSDVTRLGVPPGPAVGQLLAAIEEWWEAGDFRADRKACLARLGEIARAPGAMPP